MKIVRLFFGALEKTFFVDRLYDDTKNDQENCDEALRFISSMSQEHKTLAVMSVGLTKKVDGTDDVKPALLNFALIPELIILNISVYTTKEKEDSE